MTFALVEASMRAARVVIRSIPACLLVILQKVLPKWRSRQLWAFFQSGIMPLALISAALVGVVK
jgi:hypothetical protein